MTRRKQKKSKAVFIIILLIILACIIGVWYFSGDSTTQPNESTPVPTVTPTVVPTQTAAPTQTATPVSTPVASSGKELKIHFINIGQGDAILLTYDGENAMVDAGKSTQKNDIDSTAAITTYLDTLGVKELEFMLISHQDYDHIGSAKTILSKYPTKVFYDNGFVHTSATYEKLMQYIDEENIPYKVISAGDTIPSPWNGVTITVLSPPKDYISDDVNDNSIVVKITYGNVSYLLTGDATKDTENYILSTGTNIDSDILKVGHHGSKYSSAASFLKAVSPTVSILSGGDRNSYGHPHKAALVQLGANTKYLYRTDIDGTIVVSSDGKTYTINTENNLPYNAATEFVTGNGEAISA